MSGVTLPTGTVGSPHGAFSLLWEPKAHRGTCQSTMKLFTAAPVLTAWVTHRLLLPDWVESVELVSLVGMRTMPVSTRTEAEGLRMVNMPEVEDMWRSGSVARTSFLPVFLSPLVYTPSLS